jgi:hypothetical protein
MEEAMTDRVPDGRRLEHDSVMRRVRSAVAAGLLIASLVTSASAQSASVRFEGRVLWIAGQTMVVALPDARTVHIDLRRVAQRDYHVLGRNEWVVVEAVIPRGDGRHRVIATSIQRLGPASVESP